MQVGIIRRLSTMVELTGRRTCRKAISSQTSCSTATCSMKRTDAGKNNPRRCRSMQQRMAKLVAFVALAHQMTKTSAQTLCGCSPSVYKFRLNFGLSCADTSISVSNGISDVVCNTNPNVSVNPPSAEATSIQILELDQFQKILRTDMITNVQRDGDEIEYRSYIASSQTPEVDRVPGSLEVAIMARDESSTNIYQQWVIQFTNACDVYPVISPGQQIGWITMVSVEPPPVNYCPAAAGATSYPTMFRTVAPTGTFAKRPTPRPTTRVAKAPTFRPRSSKGPSPAIPTHPSSQPNIKRLPTHDPTHCPPYSKSKKGSTFQFVFDHGGCYYPSKSSKSKKGSKKTSKSIKSKKSKCSSSSSKGSGKGKGGKGKGGKGKGSSKSELGGGCFPTPRPQQNTPSVVPPAPSPARPTLRPVHSSQDFDDMLPTPRPKPASADFDDSTNGGGLGSLPPIASTTTDGVSPVPTNEDTSSAAILTTEDKPSNISYGMVFGFVAGAVAVVLSTVAIALRVRSRRYSVKSKKSLVRGGAATAEESVPMNSQGSIEESTVTDRRGDDEYSHIYLRE